MPTKVDFVPPGQARFLATAAEADAVMSGDTLEIGKSTVSSTVLVSAGALAASGAMGDDTSLPYGTTADQMIWVVVYAGGYKPEFAHGQVFNWGAVMIDQATGGVIGDFAGNGAVPAFIAASPAAARSSGTSCIRTRAASFVPASFSSRCGVTR